MNRFDIAREKATGKRVAILEVIEGSAYYIRDVNVLGIRVGEVREAKEEELEEWSDSITPVPGTIPE